MQQLHHLCAFSATFALPMIAFGNVSVLAYAVNPANGHKYALLDNASWTDAQARSRQLGGTLATVRSQSENDWLFERFSFFGGIGRALWIGLNDRQSEGTFVWDSGESPAFRNWSQNQPDAFNTNQDYCCIIPRNNWYSGAQVRKWDDFNNYVTFGNTTMNGVVEIFPSRCPCDLNDDLIVNDSDFQVFALAYDLLDCGDAAMPVLCPADFNNDGVVDDRDFSLFVVAYDELVCP